MNTYSWPATLSLELTSACNNNCLGCSNLFANHRQPAPLPAAQWLAWLCDFAPEVVQIRLTGGEPTLHPEFAQILAAACSFDAHVTVFTNARWADPDPLLAEMKRHTKLSGLLISLHGARAASHEAFSETPESFDEAVSNIQRALAAGIRVSLSTILTRCTCDEIDAVVQLGKELGVSAIAFNRYLGLPLPAIEPSHEQLKQAIVQISQLAAQGEQVRFGVGIPQCFVGNPSEGCMAGVAYGVIDPWGTLRPCAHSPSQIGSLQQSSLYDLWHSPAMNAWRALFPPSCVECSAVEVCHGGCRALPELLPTRRDPLRKHTLAAYRPAASVRRIPARVRPKANFRLRKESFGFVLIGNGHAYPIPIEAEAVVQLCDGSKTFAEIGQVSGQKAVNLLGELWERGLLEGE